MRRFIVDWLVAWRITAILANQNDKVVGLKTRFKNAPQPNAQGGLIETFLLTVSCYFTLCGIYMTVTIQLKHFHHQYIRTGDNIGGGSSANYAIFCSKPPSACIHLITIEKQVCKHILRFKSKEK